MFRFALFFIFTCQVLMAFSSNAINAYAISIYNEAKKEEPLQAINKTTQDYNGVVFTKIHAFGTFLHDKPSAKIGNSKGTIQSEKPIVKNGLIIGYEIVFKFYTVQSGYLEVYIGEKLFDRSVFVK